MSGGFGKLSSIMVGVEALYLGESARTLRFPPVTCQMLDAWFAMWMWRGASGGMKIAL